MSVFRSMRRWPAWARFARDLLVLVAIFAGIQWWQARDMVGGAAPPLVGLSPDGSPLALADMGDGPVLVHFWATWCPICRLQEDGIASIAGDHRVLTVATTSGNAADVARHLAEQGIAMPVVLDEGGDLGRRWGVSGVPASFVVDRAGRIDYATRGYSSELGLRLRLWLAD